MRLVDPYVSVIVPNYNHARYLKDRIDSILKQTFTDFELIIIDDASNDYSMDIIRSYESHPRVKIFENKKNSGSTFKQWDKGIDLATGKLIWIAESDDIAHHQMLEVLVMLMKRHPSVGIAYSQSAYIDKDNKIIGTHLENTVSLDKSLWRRNFVMDGNNLLSKYMIVTNVIPNASAVLFKKSAYLNCGGADKNTRLCGDWKTWSKMLANHDVGFIALPLNYFRIHNKTVRSRMYYKIGYLIEYMSVVKFIYSNVYVKKTTKLKALKELWIKYLKMCLHQRKHLNDRKNLKVLKDVSYVYGNLQATLLYFIGMLACYASVIYYRRK
jgi:glycosyltransferase involved in cell wall biosynthesis